MKKEFQQIGFRLRTLQRRDWRYQHVAIHRDQRKLTDIVALCCYFDRVARTLTVGKAHFGLRSAASSYTQTEMLTLCCYGVEVRLVDHTGLGLCQRLRETLPPEFTAPSKPSAVSVEYTITAAIPPDLAEASEFLISCDGVAVFATAVEEELYWWLRRDIDLVVARRSAQRLFVHAGVVGWRGVGIVIPGAGSIGKSRLVGQLVRRGAVYYSDVFAVLDEQGRVHPYRGRIGLDVEAHPPNLRQVREDGATEPLSIGLIVSGAYTAKAIWRPTVVRGPHAALPLVDATVLPREDTTRIPQIAAVGASAVGLRGPRSEAEEVAAWLLDLVDDALASRAIDAAGDNLPRLADQLARVAEIRLRSPNSWAERPLRRLEAARYVRIADFLSPAKRERLLEYVLSGENEIWEARVIDAEGRDALRDEMHQSLPLSTEHYDEIWNFFDGRLRAMLPFVRQQLDNPGFRFSLGRIEWQLTAQGRGQASTPRIDADRAQTSDPLISCIYSFHQLPKRFGGGELKLYDTWVTPAGSTGAGTSTTLEPLDNSLVFFPSDAFYEICPVKTEANTLADSSFALTIRFWEVEPPAQDGTQPAHLASGASQPALRSPAQGRPAMVGSQAKRLVAVVVPAYRFPLSADDQIAIRHLRTHLGGFDRYMIGPQMPPAEFADFRRAPAAANNYVDHTSYSRLLMSERFYRAFEGYEYILIYQLDCLVFSNALEAWCHKGYDYVGAPWFERWHQFHSEQPEYSDDVVDALGTVGNGGFSLRKVSTALAVLTSPKQPLYDRMLQEQGKTPELRLPEDQFWSFHAPTLVDGFRIPKAREALQFAFEAEPRYCYRENGYRLPFGCHYWPRLDRDFWEPFLLK